MLNSFDRNLDSIWYENPMLIKQFIEQRADYEALYAEVVYILTKRLKNYRIEYSIVSGRAKTLSSFLDKIQRKNYLNPFEDIKDLAAVRVVCLYKRDIFSIESIVYDEFDVVDWTDKLGDKGADRFGYSAMHYIAKLKAETSGARYEDLKHLEFEIQVRTVLQDAWAIINHHLAYKYESKVPLHLQRELNGVAGQLERADNDFNEISQKITDAAQLLDNQVNYENFLAYLSWKFKDVPVQERLDEAESVFNLIDKNRYKTLLQLDKAIQLTEHDKAEIARLLRAAGRMGQNNAAFRAHLALAISDENFRNQVILGKTWSKFINERLSTSD